MTEAPVLKKIVRYLESLRKAGRPVWWAKIRKGPYQKSGLPDLFVIFGGRVLGLEVKATDGEATPLQLETLRRIRASGAVAEVVDSVDHVRAILERLEVKHVA